MLGGKESEEDSPEDSPKDSTIVSGEDGSAFRQAAFKRRVERRRGIGGRTCKVPLERDRKVLEGMSTLRGGSTKGLEGHRASKAKTIEGKEEDAARVEVHLPRETIIGNKEKRIDRRRKLGLLLL